MDIYNCSYIEILESIDEEAENKLRDIRTQCARNLIDRLNRRQREWNDAFLEILKKSREDEGVELKELQTNPIPDIADTPKLEINPKSDEIVKSNTLSDKGKDFNETIVADQIEVDLDLEKNKEHEFNDKYFSNFISLNEYVRIQQFLETTRDSCLDVNSNPSLKSFKNELNMFIRTQINSISNSDAQLLNTKINLLTSLFNGQRVNFQGKAIDASRHPEGQRYSLYIAAQLFVTVGSKLVNSVPAIAKSMAIVMDGIVKNNIPMFKDLVVGNLQERCPYLVPLTPKLQDFSGDKKNTTKINQTVMSDQEVKYKIACGYNYDSKSQTLESEEKYLSRMRSLVLIYSCLLIQTKLGEAWTWLASFLSLKPETVISATILQAFLQESSKKMSSTYGRQYNKLIAFIRNHYIKKVEDVTPKGTDRQSLIKLKNLLSNDSNLFDTRVTMISIFKNV